MHKKHTLTDYEIRINRVIAHIYDHLDEDLNMDSLAEIACFSPYHWHRIYRGLAGETAIQTVRRLRLQRASDALLQSKMSIEQIARQAQYGSVEAFSRAFAKNYQKTAPSHPQPTKDKKIMNVEIRDVAPLKLITVRHLGPYMEIGKSFQQLVAWAMARDLVNDKSRTIGVYFDDPQAVASKDLRALAGGVVDADFVPDDDQVELYDIVGGRTAVLRVKGPYADLAKGYDWLFRTWLPDSGEQPADAPAYEEYLNSPETTPPQELLTEICLPLRS